MSDAPDMRPMDWAEVAARAHEEGRRKGLEDAAKRVEGTSPRFIYKEVADVLRAMMEETHD